MAACGRTPRPIFGLTVCVIMLDIAINIVLAQLEETATLNVCIRDDLVLNCNETQVINIQNAYYGRMQSGVCGVAPGEGSEVGCRTDVHRAMDLVCGGRRACTYKVFDLHDYVKQYIEEYNPIDACNPQQISYLQIEYHCLIIETGNASECRVSNRTAVTKPGGHVTYQTNPQPPVGTEACPYYISALPGQRIRFTLYRYEYEYLYWSPNVPIETNCGEWIVFIENGDEVRISLCDADKQNRENYIYTSNSHQVAFYPLHQNPDEETPYNLIQYHTIGCTYFEAPPNMFVTFDLDVATVACNTTNQYWRLTCSINQWLGEIGNCTEVVIKKTPSAFPWGIVVAVAIGIIVGVLVGLSLLAIVLICRRCCCPDPPQQTRRAVPPMTEIISQAELMAKERGGSGRAAQPPYRRSNYAPQPLPPGVHVVRASVEHPDYDGKRHLMPMYNRPESVQGTMSTTISGATLSRPSRMADARSLESEHIYEKYQMRSTGSVPSIPSIQSSDSIENLPMPPPSIAESSHQY